MSKRRYYQIGLILCFVLFMALGIGSFSRSYASTTELENFATDSTKWNVSANTATNYTFADDGMRLSGDNGKIMLKDFTSSNAVINIETIAESTEAGSWGFNYIIFKDMTTAGESSIELAGSPTASGTFLAFVWGKSQRPSIYNVVNGKITITADETLFSKRIANEDNDNMHQKKNKIIIEMADSDDGVSVKISFWGESTGSTYTANYAAGKEFLGEGKVGVGFRSGGLNVPDKSVGYSLVSIEEKADKDITNLALYSSNWTNKTDFDFTDSGMEQNKLGASNLLTKKIAKDATLYISQSANLRTVEDGGWSHDYIVFKAKTKDYTFSPAGTGGVGTGTFMALLWGGGKNGIMLIECVDGVVTTTEKGMNGNATWYPSATTTDIELTTTDTETGVNVSIKLKNSNFADIQSATFSSMQTAFLGDYYMSVGFNGANSTVTDSPKFVYTKVKATAYAVEEEPEVPTELEELEPAIANLATNSDNFSGGIKADSFVFGNDGATSSSAVSATLGNHTASLTTVKDAAADAKIAVDFEGIIGDKNPTWGGFFITFKDRSLEPVNNLLLPDYATNKTDNYLALAIGHVGAKLYDVSNGVTKTTDLATMLGNNNCFYPYKNRIRIIIETTDKVDGVDIKITLYNDTTKETKDAMVSSSNTNVLGEGAVSLGCYMGYTGTESFKIHKLGIETLVNRTDKDIRLNLATSNEYWKDGVMSNAIKFDKSGMWLNGVSKGGMSLYNKVDANTTINFKFDGNLNDSAYGNVYVMLKKANNSYYDLPIPLDETSKVEGSFLGVMFGGDGLKIFECIDGNLEIIGYGNGNEDIWFWYKQKLNVTITLLDTEDGVTVTAKFVGNSTKEITYNSENKIFQGDSYLSLQYLVSTMGDEDKHISLSSMRIDGITEFTPPSVDVETINENVITLLNTKITASNINEVKAELKAITENYEMMNYPQIKLFDKTSYELVKDNVKSYEAEVENINAIIALIDALPNAIDAENYATTKNKINTVASMYDSLSLESKNLVTNKEKLNSAKISLKAYEDSLISSSSSSQQETDTSHTKKGCNSITTGSIEVLITILSSVIVLRRKRK